MRRLSLPLSAALAALLALAAPSLRAAERDDPSTYSFDDSPRDEILDYPDWFKESFLDLPDDLDAAVEAGKTGLVVYFGQRRCAYCHKLMDVNFALEDIVEYTRRHFDVVPIDIWGLAEVTDIDGEVLTERDYSLKHGTNFTPSLIFYDQGGREALRLRGYYPPYQFRAALEYVAGGHYRKEGFRDYLARGEGSLVFEPGDLNDQDFFSPPPYNLDRSRFPGERPLAVFFEQGECHACDVLHGQSLRKPAIYGLVEGLDNVQLDMWSDAPVITPDGRRTTAREWAADLGLFFAPTIIFFDERGAEILRLDSVVGFFRLRNVLTYITSRSYLTESYQAWRTTREL